ncbi:MAG: hypothetical protein J0H68_09460 [Sphingobacteriia bacterium]|nr:hypothetical protein [Sphingobacteriia bacterium]
MLSQITLPTNIVIVDDDEQFLNALLSALPDDKNYYTVFSDPIQALEYLVKHNHLSLLDAKNILATYKEKGTWYLDINEVATEIENPDRFSSISVLIIDYKMKDINGLEVLKKIKGKNIKKILLSGVADESIANTAFNEKLIDNYIRKQDIDFISKLKQLIDLYHKSHFNIALPFEANEDHFFTDVTYKNILDDLIEREKIVEYYQIDSKGSLLLFNSEGVGFIFFITDDEEIEDDIISLKEEKCPKYLIDKLITREKMLLNYHFLNNEKDNFENSFYPLYPLPGQKGLYYSIIKGIEHFAKKEKAFFYSFRNKLRNIQEEDES